MGITAYFKNLFKTKTKDDKHLTKVEDKSKLEISSTNEHTVIEDLSSDNKKSLVGLLVNNPHLDMSKDRQELSSPEEGVTDKDSNVKDNTAISHEYVTVESLLLDPLPSSESLEAAQHLPPLVAQSIEEDSSQQIPQDDRY